MSTRDRAVLVGVQLPGVDAVEHTASLAELGRLVRRLYEHLSLIVLGAELPTGRWVPVQADVVVPWAGAPQYLLAAASNPNVSYTLDGNVTVEHYLSIRAPFQTGGTVPRSFFLGGATNTVNSVINSVMPGFGGVQLQ